MLKKLKNTINENLGLFINNVKIEHELEKLSPILFQNIKDFVLRDGKRIRPMLFVLGYKSFSKRNAPNLYRSALALELLHDFMLVHDDIIDKADTRRGKPSMHVLFNRHLKSYKRAKFNGKDLAIITGDILYALALEAFLSVKEKPENKEKALKLFIETTMFTGCGEFIELILSAKDISKVGKKEIFRIYDYKTAFYTFAAPLSMGATLAGASQNEIKKLRDYGLYLGRAFQIKDDILGIFGNEKQIGKPNLSDLQEEKKTILIWQAYHNSNKTVKKQISDTFSKQQVTRKDLSIIKKIIIDSGSLDYCKKTITDLIKSAKSVINDSTMPPTYKKHLYGYCDKILDI